MLSDIGIRVQWKRLSEADTGTDHVSGGMEIFEHGGYVVFDGTRGSLEHLAEALEAMEEADGEPEAGEVAGKIRRGIEKGATRIAVEHGRAHYAAEALEADDGELAERLLEDVEPGLRELGALNSG